MEHGFFYIYNLKQSEFFLQHNLPLLEINVRNGRVYHKFERDASAEGVFTLWCNNK